MLLSKETRVTKLISICKNYQTIEFRMDSSELQINLFFLILIN